MTRKEWYALILKEIEVRFDRGNSIQWKNRDFEDLSLEILESTKVLISVSTLKRIFGSVQTKGDYYPQRTTLLALKEFSKVTIKEPRETSTDSNASEESEHEHEVINHREKITSKKINTKSKIFSNKYAVYSFGFLFLVLAIGLFTYFRDANKIIDTKFRIISTEGKHSYMSAKFSFDISQVKDSVFLRNSAYPRKTFLSTKENQISVFFNCARSYFLHLSSKGKAISDSICVLVESNGWESYVDYYQGTPYDRLTPIESSKAIKDKCFHFTKNTLSKYGIDTNRYILCHFNNFKQTKENGDSFIFDATLKNTVFWTTLRCNAIELQIAGDKGDIKFELLNRGCSTYSYAVLSEKYFNGTTADLSSLTNDFSDFRKIQIINTNKTVTFLLEGKEIYKNKYEKSIGNLIGVSIVFHGSGYAKSISLKKDANSEPLFEF